MASHRARSRPSFEALEARLTLSAVPAAELSALAAKKSAPPIVAVPPPPTSETLIILTEFTKAYLSKVGEPNYNPAFDLNHNGRIGQDDGRLLLRSLPPLSPKIPITLSVGIAPQDKAQGPVPLNSGGVTFLKEPLVIGHTTPGALIFTGTGTVDLRLTSPAVVANAQGDYAFRMRLTDGINQLDLQAVDPYGQQTLRAYPILWLGFAKYEAMHPAKT